MINTQYLAQYHFYGIFKQNRHQNFKLSSSNDSGFVAADTTVCPFFLSVAVIPAKIHIISVYSLLYAHHTALSRYRLCVCVYLNVHLCVCVDVPHM